ncbi:UNKNOWN [Stylonychia lemnae]|uniref:Uncharacterized protein n=1 Tax=Stylonychia lemnae TaxID=5949 RepID=A0A078B2B4_STYLE|nr:UNKNOWN [Stylonychia lemnae]|eukprot:CDW87613.1 UNKNOWN [Stylonychia lemnae]
MLISGKLQYLWRLTYCKVKNKHTFNIYPNPKQQYFNAKMIMGYQGQSFVTDKWFLNRLKQLRSCILLALALIM